MAVYKLLDEFYEHTYSLIAIHGSLEDYRLAYFLNTYVNIRLKRLKNDLLLENDLGFPVFEWYDEGQEICWNLVKNKLIVQNIQDTKADIFGSRTAVEMQYLVPEMPAVDYFLKIDNEANYPYSALVVKKIKEIPQVVTAYEIDAEQLKSKNNLIFLTNAK